MDEKEFRYKETKFIPKSFDVVTVRIAAERISEISGYPKRGKHTDAFIDLANAIASETRK